jgi:carbon monoxide dehydrogenase subunit G
MELSGQRVLPTDRASAWRALNDPRILKASIPGCEAIEKTGENEYAVTIAAALGPVRAKFRGKLRVEDIVAPESYTLRFEGDAGPAGLAKGSARVTLAAKDGGTLLDYKVSAQVSGRIAQVGSRLIDSAALKLADEFFSAFQKQAAPQAVAAKPEEEPVPLGRYIAMAAILAALVASVAYTLR